MSVVFALKIIRLVAASGLMILVLLHSPKGDGLGGLGGTTQMFTSAKSAEVALSRLTWILFSVFLSLTIVLSAGWIK